MAKNDALFSYVAPGNIFAWALMPLRYCMTMEQYVRFNRAVIKTTHFPLLLCIFCYEKLFLAPEMYEATDLVDRPRGRPHAFSDPGVFSPSARVREESVVGYQKDQALEEVFRRVPDMRTQRRTERRKTQTEIRSWMDQYEGGFNSPQNYSTIDSRMGSDWLRRLSMNRERPSRFPKLYSDIRSTASDPADFIPDAPYPMAPAVYDDGIARRDYAFEVKENTDADGDDELVTNDEDEGDDMTNAMDDLGPVREDVIDEDYFTTPVAPRFAAAELPVDSPRPTTSRRIPLHTRTLSTNTILYAPEDAQAYSSSSASARPFSRPLSTRHTPVATPLTPGAGRRSPRRTLYLSARPRSMIQPSTAPHRSTGGLTLDIPNIASGSGLPPARRRSLADLLMTPTAGANSNDTPTRDRDRDRERDTLSQDDARSNSTDVDRQMLARMQSLEASLGNMVREMRTLTAAPGVGGGGGGGRRRKSVPGMAAWNSDEGAVAAAANARSWGRHHGQHHLSHSQQQHQHYSQREQQQQQYQQYQHQQYVDRGRVVVGSDPSLVSGAALIEAAARERDLERERDRERERLGLGSGAGRRLRAVVGGSGGVGSGSGGGGFAANTSTLRKSATAMPGRRAGIWKSPRGEGPTAGLGIKGVVREKGKEREREKERERAGVSPRTEMGMSPPDRDDEEGVSTKGISL
jgi:hypothetical protein